MFFLGAKFLVVICGSLQVSKNPVGNLSESCLILLWKAGTREKVRGQKGCKKLRQDGALSSCGGGGGVKPSRAPLSLTKPIHLEINEVFATCSILPPEWDVSPNSPSQCYPLPSHSCNMLPVPIYSPGRREAM